jgi:hypothetical protein
LEKRVGWWVFKIYLSPKGIILQEKHVFYFSENVLSVNRKTRLVREKFSSPRKSVLVHGKTIFSRRKNLSQKILYLLFMENTEIRFDRKVVGLIE